MTRVEFERWFAARKNRALYVRSPYQIVACHCGDVNCHGWRFVEVRSS